MGDRRLDAVLLDAGGTLVRLDFEWMSEALAELGVRVEPAALRRGEIEGRRRYDSSRGRPLVPGAEPQPLGSAHDTRAYFAGMLVAAGVPESRVDETLALFRTRHEAVGLWNRPVEGARGALDALAAMGVRCACVSNSDGRAERHLIDNGVHAGLELVVDSFLVGVEKPDPRIFRAALERLAVRPEHAIYVGDIRSVDEEGARAAGLHFVLLDPYGDYAGPDTPAIAGIERLPAHLAARFELPAPARGTVLDRREGGGTR